MNIQWIGSPNFTKGRQGNKPSLVVVHHMAGTLAATDSVFQNTVRDTSAHYGIGRDGTVHQYVQEADTAYHAGNWQINLDSIGIEHEDLAADNYTDIEYDTSAQLIARICKTYGLDENAIHPHKEYSATACPGALDIQRIKDKVKDILGGNMDSRFTEENAIRALHYLAANEPIGDSELNDWIIRFNNDPKLDLNALAADWYKNKVLKTVDSATQPYKDLLGYIGTNAKSYQVQDPNPTPVTVVFDVSDSSMFTQLGQSYDKIDYVKHSGNIQFLNDSIDSLQAQVDDLTKQLEFCKNTTVSTQPVDQPVIISTDPVTPTTPTVDMPKVGWFNQILQILIEIFKK